MQPRINLFVNIVIIAALCQLAESCSVAPTQVAGGGSDTEISGIIVDSQGTPRSNTVVKLLPASYNPVSMPAVDDSQSDTTGPDGQYRMALPERGTYNISARSLHDGSRSLIRNITIGTTAINLPTDTMRMPGSLIVQLPDSVNSHGGYIYIAGTDLFYTIDDDNRSVVLDSIPARLMPRLFLRPPGPPRDIMLIDSGRVRIEPNRLVPTGEFAAWRSAGVFHFNTTSSAANITQNIYDVPVLVRLDRTLINFSEAAPQGADLRFAKPDGTLFPYEIEMWDPLGGRAAVWLKIDTVYAGSVFQHIFCYWGNPQASPMSNGAMVFDTVRGFSAVWHLHQTGSSELPNASAAGNVLRCVNATGSEAIAAIIGRGIKLDAARNQFLDAGRVALGSVFTLTAWITPDISGLANRMIVSRTNDGLTNQAFGLRFDSNGLLDAIVNGTLLDCNIVVPPTGWSQVAVRFDGSSMSLFVNGAPQATLSTAPIAMADTAALLLGGDALDSAAAFGGVFDEITLAEVARSDTWIQFTFENQKPDSRLIEQGSAQRAP
jgi:hypothetical protein